MSKQKIDSFLLTEISLSRLELLLIDVPQHEIFISAIGERCSRRALIIKWTNKNGTIGYGECSCRPDPFYSHEFVDGAVQVVRDFIFPQLSEAKTYRDVLLILNSIRGWNFTKAAIEFALNDVIRRETGIGVIEASELPSILKVPVGVSLGLFDSVEKFDKKVGEAIELNYQRLKFKISPEYKNDQILNRISLLEQNVSLDANGSFKAGDFDLLARFAAMGFIIEQPFPPSEMYLYEDYLKSYPEFRVCLDEDIESFGNLVSLTSQMDEVNIKPGRVGGLVISLQMVDYCKENGLDAWVGGMFETGIGRAQNLQVAALISDAKAHDLSPSSRYFSRDVLVEPIIMEGGYISEDCFKNIDVDNKALKEMTTDKIILK